MHSSYPRPNKPKGLLEFCAKNTEKRLSLLTLKEYRRHNESCSLTDLPVVFSGTLKEEDISLGIFDRGIETRPHFLPFPTKVLSRTLYHYAFFYWTKSVSYPHLCGVFQQSAMTKMMFVCEKTKKFNCALLAGPRDGLPPSCKQPCSLQLRDVARIDSDWRKGRRSPPGPCFRDLPLHRFFSEKEKKRMEKGFSLSTDIRREKEGRLSL